MSDETTRVPRAGIIGLGVMGMGIATALLERDMTVTGFDISAEACSTFAARGGQSASTPAGWLNGPTSYC